MGDTLISSFDGTTLEEKELLKSIYDIYLKYLNFEIEDEEYFDLLRNSGIHKLSSGGVGYTSFQSLSRACTRYSNLYYKEVLGKKDSYLSDLKKKSDKYRKSFNSKKVTLLKEMYHNYVSYSNGNISEDEFNQIVLDTDLSLLSDTQFENLSIKKRSYIIYVKKYALEFLEMDEEEFQEIKDRLVLKAEMEVYSKEAKPILKQIYDCYFKYLNKEIGEEEFYQTIKEYGIEKFSSHKNLDIKQLKQLCGKCVCYYANSVLKIDTKQFEEMRRKSPLYKEKNNSEQYSLEAIELMKHIYNISLKYWNLEIDYTTYKQFIENIDFSVITNRTSYHNNKLFSASFYTRYYATKYLGLSEEEFKKKKCTSKLYKCSYEIYKRYVNLECSYEEIRNFRNKTGAKLSSYAKEYTEFMKMNDEYDRILEARTKNQDSLVYERSKNSKYYEMVEKLDLFFDFDEFVYLTLYEELDLLALKGRIFDYLIIKYRGSLSSDEFDEKLKLLRDRLETVKVFVKDIKSNNRKQEIKKEREKKQAQLYSYAELLVKEFIDTQGARVYKFTKDKEISVYQFSQLVEIVEKNNPKLYEKYRVKTKANKDQSYYIIVQNILNVIKCIKYGRRNPYTGKVRKFTAFDYFEIIPSSYANYLDFMRLAKDVLEPNDLQLLQVFINKNPINIQQNDTEIIMKSKIIFKDKVISKKEKQEILDYMNKYKIPITISLFQRGLKKYLDGDLYPIELLEEEEVKSEQKKK